MVFQSRKHKVGVAGLVSVDDYYPSEGHGLFCEVRYDADPKDATVVVQRREKSRLGVLGFLLDLFGVPTRSTMMTSNRPLEDRGKLIGDVPSAAAILDRFLHHAEIITITGRRYRLRNQGGKDGPSAENDQPSKEKEPKRSRRESTDPPSAE